MRSIFIASLVLAALALFDRRRPSGRTQRPIVCVHGNGDTAGLWIAVF
jgi:hypothetical protein